MTALKRFLIALLILSMTCTPLVACQKQAPVTDPEQTEGQPAQTGEIALLDEPIVLCEKGKSYYRIVRPSASISAVGDAVTMLLDYPSTHAAPGLSLGWGNDKKEPEAAEILIGYTNRPESLEVLNSIAYDDFAIVVKNGKIVVAAHTEERLTQATKFLRDNLLQIRTGESGQKEMVFLGSYHFVGEKQFLFGKDNSLQSYTIVYKKNSTILKGVAEKFRDMLKASYGVELNVVTDSTEEQAHEILIGDVNRPLAKECFYDTPQSSDYSYTVKVKGTQILIGAKMDRVTEFGFDSICENYMMSAYSPLFNLPVDYCEVKEVVSFSDSAVLTEGANLRVMSFNILCELWDAEADIGRREIPVSAPILTYRPDILGLQEVSGNWHTALMPYIDDVYAVVDAKDGLGHANFCPLLYNTETLTLLEHGVKTLPYAGTGNTSGLRVLSWGYFERKSDGARFVAINTHWNAGSEASDNTKRLTQAKDMVSFIETVKSIYNCPIVTTGDYNNRMGQEPYDYYVSKTGFMDAGLNAKVINRSIKTTHGGLYKHSVTEGYAIDHVFASEEFEILYYNALCDKALAGASDHYPVYADLKLTKQ